MSLLWEGGVTNGSATNNAGVGKDDWVRHWTLQKVFSTKYLINIDVWQIISQIYNICWHLLLFSMDTEKMRYPPTPFFGIKIIWDFLRKVFFCNTWNIFPEAFRSQFQNLLLTSDKQEYSRSRTTLLFMWWQWLAFSIWKDIVVKFIKCVRGWQKVPLEFSKLLLSLSLPCNVNPWKVAAAQDVYATEFVIFFSSLSSSISSFFTNIYFVSIRDKYFLCYIFLCKVNHWKIYGHKLVTFFHSYFHQHKIHCFGPIKLIFALKKHYCN